MVVRAVAALIAVLVGLLAPVPAAAEEDEESVWHRATCFSGAIDSIEVTQQSKAEDLAFLRLTGHLDCGSSDKLATFGYAKFGNSEWGQLARRDLRRYRNVPPTPFSEGRYVQDGPVYLVICVVTDFDVKVACVEVSRDAPGAELRAVPLAEKDVTWERDVWHAFKDGYRPACGGCW